MSGGGINFSPIIYKNSNVRDQISKETPLANKSTIVFAWQVSEFPLLLCAGSAIYNKLNPIK